MTKRRFQRVSSRRLSFMQWGIKYCPSRWRVRLRDKVDLDKVALFKVTEGLGLGMGGMNGTCGTISAAAVLAGLKDSTGDPELANSKAVSYKDARRVHRAFP